MGKAFRWLLPHPLLTLLLAVVWTLLQNDLTAGMVVFGLILGVIIPLGTSVWWPDTPRAFRMGKMIAYCFVVIWDIIVANVQVAWIVLTRANDKLRPAWIEVPLDLKQPEAITVLAGTITLTPGTLTIDECPNGEYLYVHTMFGADADAVRKDIDELRAMLRWGVFA